MVRSKVRRFGCAVFRVRREHFPKEKRSDPGVEPGRCRRHRLRLGEKRSNLTTLKGIPVTMAKGIHLFPSRTQKLSLSAPMVLGWRRPGRVGRCRIPQKALHLQGFFYLLTHLWRRLSVSWRTPESPVSRFDPMTFFKDPDGLPVEIHEQAFRVC